MIQLYIDDLCKKYNRELLNRFTKEAQEKGLSINKLLYSNEDDESNQEFEELFLLVQQDFLLKSFFINDPRIAALLLDIAGCPGPCKLVADLRDSDLSPKFNNTETTNSYNHKNQQHVQQLRFHQDNAKILLEKMVEIGIVLKTGSVYSLNDANSVGEFFAEELFGNRSML